MIEGLDCPCAKPASLDVSWMDNENWRAPMSIQDNKIDKKQILKKACLVAVVLMTPLRDYFNIASVENLLSFDVTTLKIWYSIFPSIYCTLAASIILQACNANTYMLILDNIIGRISNVSAKLLKTDFDIKRTRN